MFILRRCCSPYTEDDIILGVFTTEENAMHAKDTYISHLTKNGDSHQIQAYMTINLNVDVMIDEFKDTDFDSGKRIHLLFLTSEGFGQGFRTIEYMTSDRDELEEYKKLHPLEGGMFPEYYEQDMVIVDRLRFENGRL